MSPKGSKSSAETSQAKEPRRTANPTLALSDVLASSRMDWARIAGSLPKTPLVSTAVQNMMRNLGTEHASLARSFSAAHSAQFLGIAMQLQSQQSDLVKGLGISSGLTEALRGVGAQQGLFAAALNVQKAALGTSALASISKSLEMQHDSLARGVAAIVSSRSHLRLAELTAASSATWYKSITAGLIAAGGAPRFSRIGTGAAIARPLRAYTEFSARTLERLAGHGQSSRDTAPLARSLEVAQAELMETSVAAPDVLRLVSDKVFEPGPRPIRRLNLLTVTQRELLAYDRSTDTLTADEGFLVSIAERVAAKCRSVQTLLILCNETAATSGIRRVFKLTERVGSSLVDLPWLVPTTRHQLSEFVSMMYFVLYEGAGGTSLRYRGSDLLTDSECEFIWRLKHLRNKWLLHDIEHGSQRDYRASLARRTEALEFFGLSHVPATPADFRTLHRAILDEAERFLQLLLCRLQKPVR